MKLVIIGNGFDIAHNMPTRYSNFKTYLENNDKDLFDKLNDIYNPAELWSDFENALGHPNLKFLSTLDGIFGVDQLIDSYFAEKIKDNFNKWILSIVYDQYRKITDYDIKANNLYLSFNYTDTLSSLYDIDLNNIFYIHGYAGQVAFGENLVVGHSVPNSNLRLVRSTFKDTAQIIKQNESWFKSLVSKNISEIEVIGYSYNKIDQPYFAKIAEYCPNALWILHAFSERDKSNRDNYIAELSLKKYKYYNKKPSSI